MALSRQLKFGSTLAVSVAMMGPSMAISLNPQVMVGDVGAAIPLAFLIAAFTVPLLGWCFAVLARRNRGSSGSVFDYVSSTLGRKWGIFAGIALAAIYTLTITIGSVAFAVFTQVFLDRRDWAPPNGLMFVIVLAVIAASGYIALGHPPFLTKVMLTLEIVTVCLITIASFYMLYVMLTSGGPQGQTPTADAFSLNGIPLSALALAAVIGFTSFAGFEGAATSGGESINPEKTIPKAILGTALFAGVFYFVISLIMVWAYGTSPTELATMASSDSLVGDAADQYIGVWMGDLLTLGGMASAFGTTMAGTYAASRVSYAIASSKALPAKLAKLDDKSVPRFAVLAASAIAAVICAWWIFGYNVNDAFAALSTWGGLLFMIIYLIVPIAAGKALWGPRPADKVRAFVVPFIVFVIVGFVAFKSAFPLPTGYLSIVPWLVLAIVVLAGVLAVTRAKKSDEPADLDAL